MHVGLDGIGDGLLLARWNLSLVGRSGQIADDLYGFGQGDEGTSNKGNLDRFNLVVGNGDDGVCGTAIDELDTKDGFGLRERS